MPVSPFFFSRGSVTHGFSVLNGIIQQIDQNPYEHIFVAHYEDPVFYVEVNTQPLFFRNPALLLADAFAERCQIHFFHIDGKPSGIAP